MKLFRDFISMLTLVYFPIGTLLSLFAYCPVSYSIINLAVKSVSICHSLNFVYLIDNLIKIKDSSSDFIDISLSDDTFYSRKLSIHLQMPKEILYRKQKNL
jgi:hypothetical protein